MEQVTAFYDSIGGLTGIQQLLADRVKESIYIELKTKKNRSTPELDDSDSWQFSRALSGFANSDGGVIVWGVETDKEDSASKLKPITAVTDFEARLKKSLLNSVQPFVDGVRMGSILEEDGSGAGYLKVLIPRSDKAPHRAMRADREYFRRSTEGFYRLEHFDLEDAFGRRPHPSLVMTVELVPRPGEDPHEEVKFALRNEGRGMARYVGAMCEFSRDVTIVVTNSGWGNNTNLNQGRPVVSYADNVGVIHAVPITTTIGGAIIKRAAKGTALSVQLRWYSKE
ncbi:MAG: ATP-binding protein [Nitrospirae bacterium]|nr:MAG: ATP-binding protein [Nitrospirota bacterium]